jgi:tyrosine-protein phosphatase YwqE
MNFLSDFEYFKYVTQRISDFGYIPVLVHAEKFNLLFEKTENITILKRKGLKILSDLFSFFSINSKSIKANLKYLIDNQLNDFIRTNIKSLKCSWHLPVLKNNPEYEKLFHLNIQNHLLNF